MKNIKKLKTALIAMVFTMSAMFSFAQSNNYCTSQGNNYNLLRTWIGQFQFAGINNASGNNGGYGNFTSQSTSLFLNSGNSFTITPASSGIFSGFGRYYVRIWVDYDGDGN
ncbi:MAG: hypothetical protein ABI855_20820, partial [Bacteroidota bacterium]